MKDIEELALVLGVTFKNKQLYETALTHRSYLNEHRLPAGSRQSRTSFGPGRRENNERLEFLGDAVLELVVTEYLYQNYQDPEGTLTNWRSALVKTESLSEAANRLGIDDWLRLSRGEKQGSARARTQILANAFEAIIGALYLDLGYSATREFVTQNIITTLPQILKEGSWQDAKTKFQEISQEVEGYTPVYKVLEESGPDHDKRFLIGVYVGNDQRGTGTGSSKQAAQQAAATVALNNIVQTDKTTVT